MKNGRSAIALLTLVTTLGSAAILSGCKKISSEDSVRKAAENVVETGQTTEDTVANVSRTTASYQKADLYESVVDRFAQENQVRTKYAYTEWAANANLVIEAVTQKDQHIAIHAMPATGEQRAQTVKQMNSDADSLRNLARSINRIKDHTYE